VRKREKREKVLEKAARKATRKKEGSKKRYNREKVEVSKLQSA
jgi:hypothetical protein